VWAKGTLSTGTQGFGYIVFDPLNASANDQQPVYVSGPTYDTTVITMGGHPGIVPANSNAQYVGASVGTGFTQTQVRIVSAGIRVRYIGTELNRGGQVVGIHEPTHATLNGMNITNAQAIQGSVNFKPTNQWITVLYRPVEDADMQFNSSLNPVNGTSPGSYFMAALIQAPNGVQADYEWEAYASYEYEGRNIRGKTVSHVDTTGHAAVLSTVLQSEHMAPSTVSDTQRSSSFLAQVEHYAGQALTWLVHEGASIAAPVVKAGMTTLASMLM